MKKTKVGMLGILAMAVILSFGSRTAIAMETHTQKPYAEVEKEESSEKMVEKVQEGTALVVSALREQKAQRSVGQTEVSLSVGAEVYYDGWFTRYFYINGNLGYCLEPEKFPPGDGDYVAEVLEDNTLLGKGLYYLYGGPGYTKEIEERFFASSLGKPDKIYGYCHAILSYIFDGCSLEGDAFQGLGEDSRKGIVQITEDLKAFPEPPSADLSVEPAEQECTYLEDGRQKSGTFTLKGDARNQIQIQLPEGITLCRGTEGTEDETGKVTIKGGETFFFTAPTSVTGVWETEELYGTTTNEYKALVVYGDGGEQSVGSWSYALGGSVAPVKWKVKWLDYVEVQLEKKDRETLDKNAQGAATLEGAVYELYDRQGNLVDTLVTDKEGKAVSKKLPADAYVLKEVTPSQGYNLDKEEHTVQIAKENGKVSLETIESLEEVVRGDVELVKFGQDKRGEDTEIKKPLEGIVFTITSLTTGETYDMITDEHGHASTRQLGNPRGGLPYDTYRMEETKGAEGYALMEPVEFTVSEEGQTFHYIVENKVVRSGICIEKRDKGTGKRIPVSGTSFRILTETGEEVVMHTYYPKKEEHRIFKTDETGRCLLPEQLDYGTYYLEEVQAPKGYLKGERVKFQVTGMQDFSDPMTVTFFDEPAKGKIKIQKIDKETKQPIQGVRFVIRAKEDVVTLDGTVRLRKGEQAGELVTDEKGMAVSEELYLGTYEIEETQPASGYVKARTPYEVKLQYKDQETALVEKTVVVENERIVPEKETPAPKTGDPSGMWAGFLALFVSFVIMFRISRKKR